MMDAVFGFRATKMKPQLKMAVQRINLIKNKKTTLTIIVPEKAQKYKQTNKNTIKILITCV